MRIGPTAPAGLLALAALTACAAEHEVAMRTSGATGDMVFEPSFLRIQRGDTVVFRTAQGGGHQSTSILVPHGAKPWRTPNDETARVTLDVEGVYLYLCEPHLAMGMVGVLQVGRAFNAAAAQRKAREVERRIVLNNGRFEAALRRVQ
jgi:pseudoazurin